MLSYTAPLFARVKKASIVSIILFCMPASFSPYSPLHIKELFGKSKGSIRKSWGQNFLIDPMRHAWIAGLAKEACPEKGSPVLEIGPGLGALSLALLSLGLEVYAVEIDPILVAFLQGQEAQSMFASRLSCSKAESGSFSLVHQDILPLLSSLAAGETCTFTKIYPACPAKKELFRKKEALGIGDKRLSFVCGNLPYSITSPLFIRLMRLPGLSAALLLVQEAYAKRIVDSRKRHSISIFLHNYGTWHAKGRLPCAAFYPQPKVDSTLLAFHAHQGGPLCDSGTLEKLLRLSFAMRRKKLKTNWKRHASSYFPQMQWEEWLAYAQSCHIDPEARAEDIQAEAFYALCRHISP